MDYGISFDVTGKSVQQMAQIEDALRKVGVTAVAETGKMEHAVDGLGKHFDEIQHKIIALFAIDKLKDFAMEVLNVTAEFEGFENRIKFASENTIDAGTNMAFLRKEVEHLHLPMRQVYEGFSEMEAGLKGTGIEGEKLRKLFDGISTAAATLHLPQYSLQRTLYDLKEIGEIGLNARIERSLGTALPGIGGIVKDTFGKSMHELQKDGLSGAAFLDKLGPALKKNFESGLAAYGDSLQAKMADTGNRFLQMQIDIGEKLKPVYISVMNTIISAIGKAGDFVSFLNNHSDALAKMARVVEVLAISYGIYRGSLFAVMAMEKVQTVLLGAMTVAEYTASFGAAGLAFSLETLGISIATLGLGAFAIAMGAVVAMFMEWNSALDKTVEKVSDLANVTHEFEGENKTYERLITTYNAYKKDPSRFTSGEVESLAIGVKSAYDEQHKNLVESIQPHLQNTDSVLNVTARTGEVATPMGMAKVESPLFDKLKEASDSLSSINKTTIVQQGVLEGILKDPVIKKGLKDGAKLKYDPVQESATHSSHLSGAEGGLGRAKIINIKIGTVMHVDSHDSKDLVKHAELAADYIIRAANNFSESQQGTY